MQNNGNTTTAYNVNLFLSQQDTPAGFKFQLVLHKVYNTPVAIDCDLKLQQNIVLVANIPNPQFVTPTVGRLRRSERSVADQPHAVAGTGGGRHAITLRLVDPHPVQQRHRQRRVGDAGVRARRSRPSRRSIVPQPVGTPDICSGRPSRQS